MRKLLTLTILSLGMLSVLPAWAEESQTPQEQGRGARHAQMMQKADTDGDGAISKAEFVARAEEHFARMDKNGDGKLTPDERPQRGDGQGPRGRFGGGPPTPATE